MKWLKTYKIFESKDLVYSDRDVTNKYHCALGWVRYTDVHKDSYIDIEKYFDITWDHLGWILEDLVNKCDLLYKCRVADSSGLSPGAEDYGKFGTPAEHIVIDLIPKEFEKVGYSGTNFRTYISKFHDFRGSFTRTGKPKPDILLDLLRGIEDNLKENYPYLTIRNDDYPSDEENVNKWNLYITSSQITLKIKRK